MRDWKLYAAYPRYLLVALEGHKTPLLDCDVCLISNL